MSILFEAHTNFDTLRVEQARAQADKMRWRQLHQYDELLFPGQDWRLPASCAVTDLLRPTAVGDRVSLEGVLQGMYAQRQRPVEWVDMGGGQGVPMRRIAATPAIGHMVTATNVDLFGYDFRTFSAAHAELWEKETPGITADAMRPALITANVETVALPKTADLITAVHVAQYLSNPLAAISNWYNQLTDHGFLMVTSEHDWAGYLRYRDRNSREQTIWGETPTRNLLTALQQSGVEHAATYEVDPSPGERPQLAPGRFAVMAIQKKPQTRMVVNSPKVDYWLGPSKYKSVYYDPPVDGGMPLIEIVATNPNAEQAPAA